MATNIYHLVSTVLQIISDLRGESSTNTDANRIRAVSRANQDFAKRKFWNFYLLPNQSTVGDATNDYTVGSATYPMRYKGLMELFVSATADSYKTLEGERHDILDYKQFKKRYNAKNADKIVYTWFDVANDAWKMHVNPAPAATDTITYTYYWVPPLLTLTTEYVLCPNPKIVALLALAEIYQGEDEGEAAIDAKNDAEMLINEIVGLDNTPNVNQTYRIGPAETKGIGNY